MKKLQIFVTLSLPLLFVSCSTITVSYDYDIETDFTKLKSFNWMPVTPESGMNDLAINRVKNAVNRNLQTKGFNLSDSNPDFMIAMHGGSQTKLDVVDWGYSYSRYGRYGGGYGGGHRIDTYEYQEGTLILDFVDAKAMQLIWRSSATAVVNPDSSPEQREQKVNEAVSKMLQNFPPLRSK
ncbi:MAG: DUF4136 domain-containing protein [Planctomycetota bacterium]|jgi:hypothetical protein